LEVNEYIDLKLTHAIHTSERRSYRACRRRWNWLFKDRWYPLTTPKPLEFGSAYHKGMEAWFDPFTWGRGDVETRKTLAILAFSNECNMQKAKYVIQNDGTIDPELEADFDERLELGIGMLTYYIDKISPVLDTQFKPIKVEIDFEVPVKSPEGDQLWCKCDQCKTLWLSSEIGNLDHNEWVVRNRFIGPDGNELQDDALTRLYWKIAWQGLPVTYGGRIDVLAQDENGRYWIIDWKTAARLTGDDSIEAQGDEFILLDDQITSYCWALWTLGIDVAGFIYHEQKKAFPKEPEPVKYNRKGCWYSVSRQQETSYDVYIETIQEGDPSGYASGAYDEFLAWLKENGPRYYSRKQVHRNETELKNAGLYIYLEAAEMIRPELPIYPSPGRFGCTFCAFRQPCIGQNRGEDYEYALESGYEKRDYRYWEKTKPSTDSKGGQ
jgi:PD-(D/E)XK nuclease superfamily protein